MKKLAIVILIGSLSLIVINTQAEEILFKDKAGRVLKDSDVKGMTGVVDWEIRSGKPVPAEALRLHELGRAAGQKGDSAAAFKYFEKASKLAPDWPYPLYDAAFTYLLQNDAGKAYAHYMRVLQISPRGFFTAITAADVLAKERSGKLPPGTYLYYVSLEWESDPKKKAEAIFALNTKAPKFAPGWKERAKIESTERGRLDAIEKGLNAHPDIETRGFLLINKAIIFSNSGKKSEAIKILGELALDPASPLDIEVISKKAIASLL